MKQYETTTAPYKLTFTKDGKTLPAEIPTPVDPPLPEAWQTDWRLVGFQILPTSSLGGLFVWAWECELNDR